ncbi:MAG: hypothetical protein FRX49_11294 [Trebouxia sp. A1-2]|nr:MAG: hypothetical protein FRX49_11294 [Trebouxia sp. A1-2]
MLPPSFSSGSDRSAVPRRPGIERRETALKQAQDGTEAAMLLALLQTHNPTAQGSEPKLHSLAGNVHDQSWPCQLSPLAAPSLDVPQGQTCPAAVGQHSLQYQRHRNYTGNSDQQSSAYTNFNKTVSEGLNCYPGDLFLAEVQQSALQDARQWTSIGSKQYATSSSMEPQSGHLLLAPASATTATAAASHRPGMNLCVMANGPADTASDSDPADFSAACAMDAKQTLERPFFSSFLSQQPQNTRSAVTGLQQMPQHHSQFSSITSMLTRGESPQCLPLHSTHVELAAVPPLKGQAWGSSISNPASLAITVCIPEPAYTTAAPPPLATTLFTCETAAATSVPPPLATAFCMAGDNTAEGPEDTTVPMADVLLPLCNSSMSADSRQSCSPGPSWKRDRHEQLADDLDEEAKVTSRRARNREAARRTRAKRMDTIASLSNEVQLLGSINQGLSLQLQRAVHQVDAMGQENDLLRRILIAHAEEMTEAENVSDNICTLAGDLLQLLTQGQLADKQPDLHTSRD